MKYPKTPLAQQIIQICNAKKIHHIVISPGSRNAPLIQGFSEHPNTKTYSIVDERCAGFFALGIAQQLQKPVAVVCTSGSALLNYYPAVAEAFYSNIPLIIISADRPKHLIDVGDGQTINQENVFKNHVLYSANLKQDLNDNEKRFSIKKYISSFFLDKLVHLNKDRATANQQEINAVLNIALTKKGPVHINVPFAEPLYEVQEKFTEKIQLIESKSENYTINNNAFNDFLKLWNTSEKRMVLVGVLSPNSITEKHLNFLTESTTTIVLTESTSNIHHPSFLGSIDKIIAPLTLPERKILQPDVLLTFGGMVVSKKIKQFLRTYKPKAHYHVSTSRAWDTYFKLTHHFKLKPNMFLKQLIKNREEVQSNYQKDWLTIKTNRTQKHQEYLQNIPFSDLQVFESILKKLPNNSVLHLSNSSTIRYVQLFNQNKTIIQYCNRGTSGIDGSTSTAIGNATVSLKQNILITGDLSFLYDSNGLWNNYIPKNFRIILINNSGGGIFRILPGDKKTENFSTYFETNHNLDASHLCKMYGFIYKKVENNNTLKKELTTFFEDSKQPSLLEICTPRLINDTVLINYFKNV